MVRNGSVMSRPECVRFVNIIIIADVTIASTKPNIQLERLHIEYGSTGWYYVSINDMVSCTTGHMYIIGDIISSDLLVCITYTFDNIPIATFLDTFQWKFNHNSTMFIRQNEFGMVIITKVFILSRPQCVHQLVSVWYCLTYVDATIIIDFVTWNVSIEAFVYNMFPQRLQLTSIPLAVKR